MKINALYCGDNLKIMATLPDDSIDLIYIDPPFFSTKMYEVIFGDTGERRAFEDRWKGDVYHYVTWMEPRLAQMRRLLKPSGTIYVHLDYHAVHYMKVAMDRIFGSGNFLNEIIWNYRRWPTRARHFQRMHDTILLYQKSDDAGRIFNAIYKGRAKSTLRRWGKRKIRARHDEKGRRLPSVAEEEESKGVPIDDVWDIPIIAPVAKERRGYPTQKPERLLERIIRASSKPGDIVADFFCGCGTTLAVAHKMKRRWIGCDISPTALRVVRERLMGIGATEIEMINFPMSVEELREMSPLEFQNYVINYIQGVHAPRMVGDYGVDGYTVFNRYPVQVKQQDKVGRPEIQKFESAVRREKKDKGYYFAFSFTKPAYEEAARAKHENGIDVQLWTIKKLMETDVSAEII